MIPAPPAPDLFASPAPAPAARARPTDAELDRVLAAQLIVAWAGEGGERPRLGWWATDLISRDGGIDLLQQLTPATWQWAVFQATREAARRTDAQARRGHDDPDRIRSLYHLGEDLDARLDERLAHHKRHTPDPGQALPALADHADTWHPERFFAWAGTHAAADWHPVPMGRRLVGPPPDGLDAQLGQYLAALVPAAARYPLPHHLLPAGARSR